MELVADVIGRAAAIELIRCMGGVNIYIPKAGPVEIMERLRTNAMDVKLTAKEMGVSQSKVYQI